MIPRKIYQDIQPWIEKRPYVIIKGARRVGKTTLLKQIQGNIKEKSAFINADDLNISEKISTPEDLIFYLKVFHQFSSEEKFVLFLDEFQVIPQAGLFLKNLYDCYPLLKIFASGSSSLEITKNSEFLTGRSVEFFMETVSFSEFFSWKEAVDISTLRLEDSDNWERFWKFYGDRITYYIREYISWGGYPEILLEENLDLKTKLLEEYVKKYLQKDVAGFLKVENISAFNHLLKLLSQDIGGFLNLHEISNTLGITHRTAEKYTEILEGTYVIKRLRPFYRNVRSEISKRPKYYFHDLGLRNHLLGINTVIGDRVDLGSEVENLVWSKLEEKTNNTVKFYRTIGGSEIDFVYEKSDKNFELIEVKFRKKVGKVRAFTQFSQKYPEFSIKKWVITQDFLRLEDEVNYVPLGMFLLL